MWEQFQLVPISERILLTPGFFRSQVLNTGFCPRAERSNLDLFMDCLITTPHAAEEAILKPKTYSRSRHGKSQIYSPPMSEFDMLQTDLKAGEKESLGAAGGPSIVLATRGNATLKAASKTYELSEGSVHFVAQGVEMELESKDGSLLHTAFVEGSTK